MKATELNVCQSCGMPIRNMADFGTYPDGSVNTDYCFHCYQDGHFTDPDATLEEKIARNITLAQRLGISREKAHRMAVSTLPGLARWRKAGRKVSP